MRCKEEDDISEVNDNDRLQNSTNQVEHDNKPHTETTETAQSRDREEDEEIVNGRIDPSTSLR